MITLVATLIVFTVMGALFLLVNLVLGWLIRPNRPSAAKGEIYECGELPVGTAWIQFDLRFYVVALLFVIFDVEMAFFFPWAVVFGTAAKAGQGAGESAQVAHQFAEFAFFEFLVFFTILLIGFAYLWRRGDLEWVRSMTAPKMTPIHPDQTIATSGLRSKTASV